MVCRPKPPNVPEEFKFLELFLERLRAFRWKQIIDPRTYATQNLYANIVDEYNDTLASSEESDYEDITTSSYESSETEEQEYSSDENENNSSLSESSPEDKWFDKATVLGRFEVRANYENNPVPSNINRQGINTGQQLGKFQIQRINGENSTLSPLVSTEIQTNQSNASQKLGQFEVQRRLPETAPEYSTVSGSKKVNTGQKLGRFHIQRINGENSTLSPPIPTKIEMNQMNASQKLGRFEVQRRILETAPESSTVSGSKKVNTDQKLGRFQIQKITGEISTLSPPVSCEIQVNQSNASQKLGRFEVQRRLLKTARESSTVSALKKEQSIGSNAGSKVGRFQIQEVVSESSTVSTLKTMRPIESNAGSRQGRFHAKNVNEKITSETTTTGKTQDTSFSNIKTAELRTPPKKPCIFNISVSYATDAASDSKGHDNTIIRETGRKEKLKLVSNVLPNSNTYVSSKNIGILQESSNAVNDSERKGLHESSNAVNISERRGLQANQNPNFISDPAKSKGPQSFKNMEMNQEDLQNFRAVKMTADKNNYFSNKKVSENIRRFSEKIDIKEAFAEITSTPHVHCESTQLPSRNFPKQNVCTNSKNSSFETNNKKETKEREAITAIPVTPSSHSFTYNESVVSEGHEDEPSQKRQQAMNNDGINLYMPVHNSTPYTRLSNRDPSAKSRFASGGSQYTSSKSQRSTCKNDDENALQNASKELLSSESRGRDIDQNEFIELSYGKFCNESNKTPVQAFPESPPNLMGNLFSGAYANSPYNTWTSSNTRKEKRLYHHKTDGIRRKGIWGYHSMPLIGLKANTYASNNELNLSFENPKLFHTNSGNPQQSPAVKSKSNYSSSVFDNQNQKLLFEENHKNIGHNYSSENLQEFEGAQHARNRGGLLKMLYKSYSLQNISDTEQVLTVPSSSDRHQASWQRHINRKRNPHNEELFPPESSRCHTRTHKNVFMPYSTDSAEKCRLPKEPKRFSEYFNEIHKPLPPALEPRRTRTDTRPHFYIDSLPTEGTRNKQRMLHKSNSSIDFKPQRKVSFSDRQQSEPFTNGAKKRKLSRHGILSHAQISSSEDISAHSTFNERLFYRPVHRGLPIFDEDINQCNNRTMTHPHETLESFPRHYNQCHYGCAHRYNSRQYIPTELHPCLESCSSFHPSFTSYGGCFSSNSCSCFQQGFHARHDRESFHSLEDIHNAHDTSFDSMFSKSEPRSHSSRDSYNLNHSGYGLDLPRMRSLRSSPTLSMLDSSENLYDSNEYSNTVDPIRGQSDTNLLHSTCNRSLFDQSENGETFPFHWKSYPENPSPGNWSMQSLEYGDSFSKSIKRHRFGKNKRKFNGDTFVTNKAAKIKKNRIRCSRRCGYYSTSSDSSFYSSEEHFIYESHSHHSCSSSEEEKVPAERSSTKMSHQMFKIGSCDNEDQPEEERDCPKERQQREDSEDDNEDQPKEKSDSAKEIQQKEDSADDNEDQTKEKRDSSKEIQQRTDLKNDNQNHKDQSTASDPHDETQQQGNQNSTLRTKWMQTMQTRQRTYTDPSSCCTDSSTPFDRQENSTFKKKSWINKPFLESSQSLDIEDVSEEGLKKPLQKNKSFPKLLIHSEVNRATGSDESISFVARDPNKPIDFRTCLRRGQMLYKEFKEKRRNT